MECNVCGKEWVDVYWLVGLYTDSEQDTPQYATGAEPGPTDWQAIAGKLAEAVGKMLVRMKGESEWLDKADYPAAFMVERHDSILSPAWAALEAYNQAKAEGSVNDEA